MKKPFYLFLVFILLLSKAYTQSAINLELFGQYDRGDNRYSGSWAYASSTGAEYALLGTSSGTAIYQIDDTTGPRELDFVPGPISNWREITVIGSHAYITTEGDGQGSGMQVLDLSNLPNSVSLITTYNDTFTRAHIIQRDIYTEAPFVYISGTNTTQGVHILDVSQPENPVEIGLYAPNYYIHDCHVNGDLLFAAAFFEGKMDVVDISDKSQPILIAEIPDINGNTHSSWMSEDRKYLFLASELDGTLGRIFNVEDINDIFPVATYTANRQSLVHNPYIRGDFAFISHNTEGLRVVDIADPTIPVEVGYYDTFEGESGGFNGLWSACPYLPSGKIIGGNREDGLYVWTFNGVRAGRICIQVIDASTETPIINASVVVEETQDTLKTGLDGRICWGGLPGDYTVLIDNPLDDLLVDRNNINLAPGSFEELIIRLDTSTMVIMEEDIPLHPNPASSWCELKVEKALADWVLYCYDIQGRNWQEVEVGENGVFQWSVSDWADGLYLYELRDGRGEAIQAGKFVVKK